MAGHSIDTISEDGLRKLADERHIEEALLASAARALDDWEINATEISLVSHSENIVFRVDSDSRQPFVLRFHRPGYHTLPELHGEFQWTAALNRSGIGAPVPRLSKDKRFFVPLILPELSQTRFVSLVEWVEGTPMATLIEQETEPSRLAAYFHKVGSLAARIHNQAAAWQVPPGFQRHAFDADGLMGSQPFWGPFWQQSNLTPAEREQIIYARDRIYSLLTDYGQDRRTYSLIHADLHPGNLITTGETVHIIDFDDSGFGWHLYELAVAISYYQDTPHFEVIRKAIIAGYLTERPLSQSDIELLPVFVLVRSMVSLGWIDQRPELDSSHKIPTLIRRSCEQSQALFGEV
ncbi:MAG: phosphotransferase [Caldilineaceae bacterium]|nr:phosphotransferase [Caldilineaceae bacterium]